MDEYIKKIPNEINKGILDACYGRDFPITGLLDLSKDEEDEFISELLKKNYSRAKDGIISLGKIEMAEGDDINNALSQLISIAVESEHEDKNMLERTCVEEIIKLFNIPEDVIDFNVSLWDMIQDDSKVLQLKPEDSPIDYNDYKEVRLMKFAVGRRYLNNMLIAGASEYYTYKILTNLLKDGIITEEALVLYIQIMGINQFLMFSDDNINLTENDKREIGFVNVKLGDDITKTEINAKAQIFPVLIYETVKGIMELLSSHSLPKDINLANSVLKKADCVENEIWYMRTGYELWLNFINGTEGIEEKDIPGLVCDVMKLPKMKYIRLMKEIINGTKKSKRILKSMYNDMEYNDFVERMKVSGDDKNIIQDEYISPEEL